MTFIDQIRSIDHVGTLTISSNNDVVTIEIGVPEHPDVIGLDFRPHDMFRLIRSLNWANNNVVFKNVKFVNQNDYGKKTVEVDMKPINLADFRRNVT